MSDNWEDGAAHLRGISELLDGPNKGDLVTKPQKVLCGGCKKNVVWQSFHAPWVVAPLCNACTADENRASEREKIREWLPRLKPHFLIDREIWGTHFSGKRLRIDAVIMPRDTANWRCKDAAFGVEFKRYEAADWGGDGARWAAQCVDYASTNWEKYGFLHILIAGGFDPRPPGKDELFVVPRLLGHLGVGELKVDPRDGLTILMHGRQKVWMETKGPYDAKTNGLERKWGAR